jgi:hypothetical protein
MGDSGRAGRDAPSMKPTSIPSRLATRRRVWPSPTSMTLLAGRPASFPPAPHARAFLGAVGVILGHLLRPAAVRGPHADVAALGELERLADVLAERVGAGERAAEPGRRHEVGDQHVADLVAQLVGLDRVARLVGVELGVADLGGQVDLRIAQHLQQLVRERHARLGAVVEIGPDERLPERQAGRVRVVIAERAGLVAGVEAGEPPRIGRLLALRNGNSGPGSDRELDNSLCR